MNISACNIFGGRVTAILRVDAYADDGECCQGVLLLPSLPLRRVRRANDQEMQL